MPEKGNDTKKVAVGHFLMVIKNGFLLLGPVKKLLYLF